MDRRLFLGAAGLPLLGGLAACGTPLPLTPAPQAAASDSSAAERAAREAGAARLLRSAQEHGLAALSSIRDINISYDGQWRPLINRIQPDVVDAGFRGRSQERLLLTDGLPSVTAQAYTGPAGQKQVAWQRGPLEAQARGEDRSSIEVWFNGQPASEPLQRKAAALVADGYGLFLLGPMWLQLRGRGARLDGSERVDGRLCDVVQVWLTPGLGQSALDRVSVCIDRDNHITRRVRFTLEGYVNTQGAVAEVDTFEHERRHGVLWPRRSYEEVVHPIRLPAHDWHITGLDVNRGYPPQALLGPRLAGAAAADAQPWPAG